MSGNDRRNPTGIALKAWALDGMRIGTIAYLGAQACSLLLVEHSLLVGCGFAVAFILCLVKKFNAIGFLLAALVQLALIVSVTPGQPPHVVMTQLYISVCCAWLYSLRRHTG